MIVDSKRCPKGHWYVGPFCPICALGGKKPGNIINYCGRFIDLLNSSYKEINMSKLLALVLLLILSCAAQESVIPLSWNYDPGFTGRFYLYTYSASDTSIIDSSRIILVDSLDSAGLTEYSKKVITNLKERTCFFAKAARLQGTLKIYSRYSNRTIFVEEAKIPENLRIAN